MARARNIKPGFYKNEDLAECSVWARLIFPGLWMLADREGRLEDRPKRIKGELLPFDSQDVDPLLDELQARGFLVRYKNSDGSFIQISKFSTHQTPHYSEKPSVIKPPPLQENSVDAVLSFPEKIASASRPNSEKDGVIKRGSQPPDSLNPDSLNPDSTSLAPDASRRGPSKVPAKRIRFDFEAGKFSGITEADELRWQEAYPAVPIPPEIERAAAWAAANPANRKSNWERFLVNWFSRTQDRAGRVAQQQPQQREFPKRVAI